jgi:hypothetical protein
MGLFTRDTSRQQTEWGRTTLGHTWLAYVDAPITDPIVKESLREI